MKKIGDYQIGDHIRFHCVYALTPYERFWGNDTQPHPLTHLTDGYVIGCRTVIMDDYQVTGDRRENTRRATGDREACLLVTENMHTRHWLVRVRDVAED